MKIKTSGTEIKHLFIAWFALSLAFTILFARHAPRFPYSNTGKLILNFYLFLISAVTVGFAFLLHELSHKIVSQKYGSWSEFRMEPFMLLITILTAFLGFVFAAPGAVVIFNPYLTTEKNGKIAIAGPLMNVALAFLFLPLTVSSSIHGILEVIGKFGVMINAYLAVFNMLPFSVLDGRKVLAWSAKVYAIVLSLAIVTFVIYIMV